MILFILPRFSGGGAERVTLNILNELHTKGYSVSILVFDKSGPLQQMIPEGILVCNLKTVTLRRSFFSLVKNIRRINPDIIFSTFGYINIPILLSRWLFSKNIKIWIREANMPSTSLSNNSYPNLISAFYRLLYKGADKVICTSVKMKNEFISDFSIPEENINILPNPVDIDKIRTSAFPINRFDKGGVCYIASGRLTFQKGFDLLLSWFSVLDDKKSTLVILGSGTIKNELLREAKLLKIQDRVNFLGFCDNPWGWLSGADVFLLSSRWEGMPDSVLEALACGTPVIATASSGGIMEISAEGLTVATNEKQFIYAMNKAKVKLDFANPSMLPEKYKQKNVITLFESWL